MRLRYFGSSARPLLGVYSPPDAALEREAAVLLCHPAPQEYMRSYWALRQLAGKLAAAGLHVLRFDYSGTGDSAGDGADASLDAWRADVLGALEELTDISGVKRPSLVGFRLGATLAAQAGAHVRTLVLWEPVVTGCAYLDELRTAHVRYFAHCLHPPRVPRSGPLGELLGHPLPPRLQTELEALELGAPFASAFDRLMLVARDVRDGYRALVNRAAAQGVAASLEHVPEPEPLDADLLLAPKAQERITQLLTGARP